MSDIQKIKVHQRTFDIEWGDMDALGHVNNGRYFDYFQQARIDWMASLDIHLTAAQGPVVIKISGTFLKPVIYPATITIISSIHSLGRSSFIMEHELYQNDQQMTQGESKIVWVDYKRNKSIPVPDAIRSLF